VTKARDCVGCRRQRGPRAAQITAYCLAAHHSGHRRSFSSMTRFGQLESRCTRRNNMSMRRDLSPRTLSTQCRVGCSPDRLLGKKQHKFLSAASSLTYRAGPQVHDSRQLSSPGRPLGLQGQWCWRPHTTVRTGTWASVVSRVGTLIDKRQPLTPKLHVRMNLHGTYARAPYSERHLDTLFLA
jgi:hypothetical protein